MAKVYDPIMCMMVDKPDKAQDELLFYQLKFGSGKTEGAKLDESEIRSYAEALLEKYDEKRVTVSRQGKIVATYMRNKDAKAKDELKIVKEDSLWCVYKDGKQVGQSNSEAGAIRIYNRLESGKDSKARDVAPATQRYINTIVDESKANAEKFVRQAEQDDEVPENELKYVYKAYNDKFGYKFHDSASALDEAIKVCDASKADMDYWVERYEKGCKNLIDAIKQGRSPIKTVQKAKQIINQDYSSHWKYLKDAFASYVVSTAKEEAKGDLSGMIDNTSKVEKREWKEFADREKKLMKAKNDALKNVEQAFK